MKKFPDADDDLEKKFDELKCECIRKHVWLEIRFNIFSKTWESRTFAPGSFTSDAESFGHNSLSDAVSALHQMVIVVPSMLKGNRIKGPGG